MAVQPCMEWVPIKKKRTNKQKNPKKTLVLVKVERKSKQITETFIVSVSGKFLSLQLIYAGKTKCNHPQRIKFPAEFDVNHS